MLELFCLKIFEFINAVQTSIDTVYSLESQTPEADQPPLVAFPSIRKITVTKQTKRNID